MTAEVLRVTRVTSMRGIKAEDGSVVRPCSHCGAGCVIAPQSLRFGDGMRLVCEVCLPAEPVGPIGSEAI